MDEDESDPMGTVILHFCSYHYMFEGYKQVCIEFHKLLNC